MTFPLIENQNTRSVFKKSYLSGPRSYLIQPESGTLSLIKSP